MYDKSTEQLNRILGDATNEEELQKYLKELKQSGDAMQIQAYFNEILAQKQLSAADVVRNSNLAPAYAYQLLNGTRTNPNRMKIIALCLGCQMTLSETQRALEIAGLRKLYPRDAADAIIIYNINKGNLSVTDINIQLDAAGLPPVE